MNHPAQQVDRSVSPPTLQVQPEPLSRTRIVCAASSPKSNGSFEDLLKNHGRQIARWATKIAGHELEVNDVVQEVLLAAYQAWPRFRGDALPTTWLFGITHRVAFRMQARERRRRGPRDLFFEDVESVATPHTSPAQAFEMKEQIESLYGALDRLPHKRRRAFILYEFEDVSAAGIAELTGVSENTVCVRLHRARKQLKKMLEPKQRKGERRCSKAPLPPAAPAARDSASSA